MAISPNALTARSIGDLMSMTLPDLGELRFTEIVTPLQDHTAMRNLLRKNKIGLQSGTSIQFNAMVNPTNSAANVGMGSSDNTNIVDVMTTGSADWRKSVTNYSIMQEVLSMNREPRRIVDLMQVARIGSLISLAELMEANFWGPPVPSTDNVTPWGVNMWVVKNATQGFNGGAPSGYTSIGLNPTTYPNWNNWTDSYSTVSRDDLVRKMRRGATKTNFRPPVDGIKSYSTGDERGYYTNYDVLGPMEEILDSQNDNLGTDVAKHDGQVHFRRSPVEWVPKLDADTTGPVYGLQWGDFKTYVLNDWWLRETHLPMVPGQHTVSAWFVDLIYNWVMKNRRTSFVIATAATYPN